MITVHHTDNLAFLRTLPENLFHSVVTDPPYGLRFMGKKWDYDVPSVELWREVLRVLRPGGHLLTFGGTRTYHRLAVNVEDAGFEIRDSLHWMYGSGFPKSLDVSKAIDKAAGAERRVVGMGAAACEYLERGEPCPGHGDRGKSQSGSTVHVPRTEPATDEAALWAGWGTALKPGHEPVVLARKPLDGTVEANVRRWGAGALNVEACRLQTTDNLNGGTYSGGKRRKQPGDERSSTAAGRYGEDGRLDPTDFVQPSGRWPPNVLLTHSYACTEDACVEDCPVAGLDAQSGPSGGSAPSSGPSLTGNYEKGRAYGARGGVPATPFHGKAKGASEFFPCSRWTDEDLVPFRYVPKAARSERELGCEHLPPRSGAEAVEREEGSAGLNNPRAGAGRTAAEVRNHHPTVKPVALMRWLARLATPKGGLLLDPFCGSGSTLVACAHEGLIGVGLEREEAYVEIARARVDVVGWPR